MHLFYWQDVSMYGNKQWRRSQTSEGHADSSSAGLCSSPLHLHYLLILNYMLSFGWESLITNCWIPECFIVHFFLQTSLHWPGVLGWAPGEEALVRWQRRLHRQSAGLTFHHRPVICRCESQAFSWHLPLKDRFKSILKQYLHAHFI